MKRETTRKRIIREVLAERGSAFLEELRWAVLRRETAERGRPLEHLERSHIESFSRTARAHFHVSKVAIADDTALGLAARSAVYRIRDWTSIEIFVGGPAPTIVCEYRKNFPVAEPRYTRRYVTPQYHMLLFDFFAEPGRTVASVRIPATHQLTIVSLNHVKTVDLSKLADAPWKLFGTRRVGTRFHPAFETFEVEPHAALSALL